MAFNWQTEYHRYQRYFVNVTQFYRQKKARVYTGIILSILTVTFFLFFAIKPTLVIITSLIKEIDDKKMVSEKLEDKVNALTLAQNQYTLVQPNLYLVEEALPTEPEVSLLIKQLEVLGRQAGVTIESIQSSQIALKGEAGQTKQTTTGEEAVRKTSSDSINFTFVASGNYQNLKNFLQTLSSLRRVVLVDSFAFKTKEAKETETGILTLSLNAQAHFLEKPE